MKTERRGYENKKSKVYNNVLGSIAGLILVWCLFYFVPMGDLYVSLSGILNNVPDAITISVFFTIATCIGLLCFSFGFYGIKRLLYTTDDMIKDEIKEEKA